MPYCVSCGKQHSETAKFCSNCGLKISTDIKDDDSQIVEKTNVIIDNIKVDSNSISSKCQEIIKDNLQVEEDKDYNYGLKNTNTQKWILDPVFLSLEYFNEKEFAIAQNDNTKYGIINLQGRWILEPIYEYLEYCIENEFAIAQNEELKFGVIDIHGKWIVDPSFENIKILNGQNGSLLVEKDDLYGIIDLTGKWIIPLEIENCPYFISDDLYAEQLVSKKFGYHKVAEVKINGKFGIIDDNGNFIIKADRLQSIMGINYEESDDEDWDEDDDELGKENISKNESPIKPKDSAGIR